MKKILSIIVSLTLIASSTLCANAETIDVNLNSVTVFADGQKLDAPNILWNGSTYIPLRATLERLGCFVDWEPTTKSAITFNAKAYISSILCKLQTQLFTIQTDLWAASQIEKEVTSYRNTVLYSDFNGYLASDDIIYKYGLIEHDNYFMTMGSGASSTEYFSYINTDEVETACAALGYDIRKYRNILLQAHNYCDNIKSALQSLDKAWKTGASMYIDQSTEYMEEANNCWNTASDEIFNLKQIIFEYIQQ